MKTINITTQHKEPEIFIDPITNQYLGFAGSVDVYNSEVYVNTKTGEGYDEVLRKLNKLIKYLSVKYKNAEFDIEDLQQDIIVYILEGIPKYDPRKTTKLSTFIQMRVDRMLINDIRNRGRDIRNATVLRTTLYSVYCRQCEDKFVMSLSNDDSIDDQECKRCKASLSTAKVFAINYPPKILGSSFRNADGLFNEDLSFNDIISANTGDIPLVYGFKAEAEDDIMSHDNVYTALKYMDEQTKQLLELICFQDYSIKDAAQVVGISHTNANNKIKNLKNKKMIKKIFGKIDD